MVEPGLNTCVHESRCVSINVSITVHIHAFACAYIMTFLLIFFISENVSFDLFSPQTLSIYRNKIEIYFSIDVLNYSSLHRLFLKLIKYNLFYS